VAHAIFDTPAIHGIPRIKEPAQAGSAMVPPLVIATAQPLRAGRLVREHRPAEHPGRARRHARASVRRFSQRRSLSVTDIHERVAATRPEVNISTVHRTAAHLAEQGVICQCVVVRRAVAP
jgi:hypothetical protein